MLQAASVPATRFADSTGPVHAQRIYVRGRFVYRTLDFTSLAIATSPGQQVGFSPALHSMDDVYAFDLATIAAKIRGGT
jgi:hypothetical protein